MGEWHGAASVFRPPGTCAGPDARWADSALRPSRQFSHGSPDGARPVARRAAVNNSPRLPVGIGILRAPQPYSLASPRIGLNDALLRLDVINLVGPLRRRPSPSVVARPVPSRR